MYKKFNWFITLSITLNLVIFTSFIPIVKADAASTITPTPTNNTSNTGSTFSLQKIAAPTTVSPNSVITYSITIQNISTTNAAPRNIEDTLPQGFSFIGNSKLTTVNGQQVEFAPTSTQGNKITWAFDGDTLQSIPPNQNIVITYQIRTGSETGNFTNRACLTNPENVCASATVNVILSPNASLNDDLIIALLVIIPSIILFITLRRNKSFEQKVLKI